MSKITNVVRTKYDGFYIAVKNNKVSSYEGFALCPKDVQKYIETNEIKELDCFWMEAIQYGMV